MKIQKAKLADLKPLITNVRRHSETQIKELIRSISQFGQTRAIVVDEDNNILIGNGLHEAMTKAGMTECSIFRKTGLSEVQKKKLILTDNKTYSLGMDDYDNIEKYLQDITSSGDFDVAGFDEDMLKNLMKDAEYVLASAKDFGKISEDEKQSFNSKRDTIDKKIENANESESPGKEYSAGAEHTEHSQSHVVESNGEVKTVICPSCGEVIPIE